MVFDALRRYDFDMFWISGYDFDNYSVVLFCFWYGLGYGLDMILECFGRVFILTWFWYGLGSEERLFRVPDGLASRKETRTAPGQPFGRFHEGSCGFHLILLWSWYGVDTVLVRFWYYFHTILIWFRYGFDMVPVSWLQKKETETAPGQPFGRFHEGSCGFHLILLWSWYGVNTSLIQFSYNFDMISIRFWYGSGELASKKGNRNSPGTGVWSIFRRFLWFWYGFEKLILIQFWYDFELVLIWFGIWFRWVDFTHYNFEFRPTSKIISYQDPISNRISIISAKPRQEQSHQQTISEIYQNYWKHIFKNLHPRDFRCYNLYRYILLNVLGYRFSFLFPHIFVWSSCFWLCTSASFFPPQPAVTTQLAHTTCPHNLRHHTTSSHNLLAHNLHTHTRNLPTQLPHTQLAHAQLTHTQHTQLAHTKLAHTSSKHTTCSHNFHAHKLLTHNLSPHNLLTHNLLAHNLSPHNLLTHTHTLLTHSLLTTYSSHTTYSHTQLVTTQLTHTHTLLTHNLRDRHTLLTHNLRGRRCWRGRRGAWRHRPPLCVAGVPLGDIDLHFAWQAWHLWHWAGSGGALGSFLVAAAVCVASVALGDIDLHFAWQVWHLVWQAWHLWHWAGSGGFCHTQLFHTHNFVAHFLHTHTTLSHISFTHNFVTHFFHTQPCHTHTTLSHNFVTHTQLFHTRNFVTHNSFTRNFVTYASFTRNTFTYTNLHAHTHNTATHSSFTQPCLHHLLYLSCLSHLIFTSAWWLLEEADMWGYPVL